MGVVLITGTSGFIGGALTSSLQTGRDVLCLGRSRPRVEAPWVRGEFWSFEDLRALDGQQIDAVVHLAAVTGGCLERDGVLINVEGTRALMRYAIDRGCRKFVLASSIAAVGMQSTRFRPLTLPIPDNHPCLDEHGYGLSKHLMEEVTRYYTRQCRDLEVINLRLASIQADDAAPEPSGVRWLSEWALGGITIMLLSDTIRALTLALETPLGPGCHTLNATGPRAWVREPVAKVLRNWWGGDVDLSYFEQPGNEFASVYDVTAIDKALGFRAQQTPDLVFPGSQG